MVLSWTRGHELIILNTYSSRKGFRSDFSSRGFLSYTGRLGMRQKPIKYIQSFLWELYRTEYISRRPLPLSSPWFLNVWFSWQGSVLLSMRWKVFLHFPAFRDSQNQLTIKNIIHEIVKGYFLVCLFVCMDGYVLAMKWGILPNLWNPWLIRLEIWCQSGSLVLVQTHFVISLNIFSSVLIIKLDSSWYYNTHGSLIRVWH